MAMGWAESDHCCPIPAQSPLWGKKNLCWAVAGQDRSGWKFFTNPNEIAPTLMR